MTFTLEEMRKAFELGCGCAANTPLADPLKVFADFIEALDSPERPTLELVAESFAHPDADIVATTVVEGPEGPPVEVVTLEAAKPGEANAII